MRIIDLLTETLKTKPLTKGDEKILYPFALEPGKSDFLLAVPTYSSRFYTRDERDQDDNWVRQLFDKMSEPQLNRLDDPDHSRINAVLKSSTSLTPAEFSVPYRGLPLRSFGQSLAIIEMGRKPYYTPNMSIHYWVEGVTLSKFCQDRVNPCAEIAQWPQDSFDHMMRQIAAARAEGHAVDMHVNNFMVNLSGNAPEITVIDLMYDKPNTARAENDISRVTQMFFQMHHDSGEDKKTWRIMFQKLVDAAKNAGLGSDYHATEVPITRLDRERNRVAQAAKKALESYPIIEPYRAYVRPRQIPPEITSITRVSINQEVSDLLSLLHQVANTRAGRAI